MKKLFSLILFSTCLSAAAQTAPTQTSEPQGWWEESKALAKKINTEGKESIMLSGYAHHGRNTYTPAKIAEYNERAWGIGYSKTIRDEKDNEQALYGMVFSDSHFKPQWNLGYTYQWMKPLGGNTEAGIGYTASLISRVDYFSNIPFPALLPVASIGTRQTKLMATYVPRISRNKGNGDVLLVFIRIDL